MDLDLLCLLTIISVPGSSLSIIKALTLLDKDVKNIRFQHLVTRRRYDQFVRQIRDFFSLYLRPSLNNTIFNLESSIIELAFRWWNKGRSLGFFPNLKAKFKTRVKRENNVVEIIIISPGELSFAQLAEKLNPVLNEHGDCWMDGWQFNSGIELKEFEEKKSQTVCSFLFTVIILLFFCYFLPIWTRLRKL